MHMYKCVITVVVLITNIIQLNSFTDIITVVIKERQLWTFFIYQLPINNLLFMCQDSFIFIIVV